MNDPGLRRPSGFWWSDVFAVGCILVILTFALIESWFRSG